MSDVNPGFGEIVDDTEALAECKAWAYGELATGRMPEDVEAELVGNGWSQDNAASIVEEARRRTRHIRGTITQGDAARATGMGDPNFVSRNIPGSHSQHPVAQLVRAVARLWTTKPKSRKPTEQD
jgi:hypothetical protein